MGFRPSGIPRLALRAYAVSLLQIRRQDSEQVQVRVGSN